MPCAACGQPISADDEVAGTPHFTADPADPLYRYTDSPFHRACYNALPERAEIEERVAELREEWLGEHQKYGGLLPPDIANPS